MRITVLELTIKRRTKKLSAKQYSELQLGRNRFFRVPTSELLNKQILFIFTI